MRCFSSPGALHTGYIFTGRYSVMKRSGLPHSEIPGYGCSHLTEAYRSVATSFIGRRHPGIHPVPLLVCPTPTRASGRGSKRLEHRGERVCHNPNPAWTVADPSQPPGEAGWRGISAVATCLSQTVGEKAKTGIDVSKCMRLERYIRPKSDSLTTGEW